MHETKAITTGAVLKQGEGERGQLTAVISRFDVVDTQGDVVLASAFTPGQRVPLVWHHNWEMPIGDGTMRVTDTEAIFDGRLWLDTTDGEQSYRRMLNAGTLQEYSWSFRILDAAIEQRDGEDVRVIKGAEMFEASPVLVGAAGRGRTGTIALKSGLTLADESGQVLAACLTLSERLRSHAELRTAKEGRVLSEANRQRLKDHADRLEVVVRDLRDLHASTAPPSVDDGKALLAAMQHAQTTLARLVGVAA